MVATRQRVCAKPVLGSAATLHANITTDTNLFMTTSFRKKPLFVQEECHRVISCRDLKTMRFLILERNAARWWDGPVVVPGPPPQGAVEGRQGVGQPSSVGRIVQRGC
jgi:hypothetical protein